MPVLTLSTTVERNTQPAIHKYFLFLVTKYIIKKTENKIAKKSASEAYDIKRPPALKVNKAFKFGNVLDQ